MAKLIAFTCPDCGKDMTASSAERNTRCEHCGKRIRLTNHPDPLPDDVKIIVPPRVKIEHAEDGLRIQYFWYKPGYIRLLLFSFIWNIIAIQFIFALPTFFTSGNPLMEAHVILIIFQSVMGILFLGWAIVLLINRTVIEIRGDQLSIRFAPFPWFGRKSIKTSELMRLVCSRHIVDSRSWLPTRGRISFYTEHEIYAFQKAARKSFFCYPTCPQRKPRIL